MIKASSKLSQKAVRLSRERKDRWDHIFQQTGKQVSAVKLQEKEIEAEIKKYRRSAKGRK